MCVYLASYKGTQPGLHGLVNIGIRVLDRAEYSHSEICIGNPFEYIANCYSSSGADGGVRTKQMKLNPAKWDIVRLAFVTPDQVRAHYEKRKGTGYDYWGTGRFVAPWLLREHPTRDFCSEYCGASIGVEDAWRFSPTGLHVISLALGGEPIFWRP